jgi:hypothetical protein
MSLNKTPRKFPFKKKSMLATWDDHDDDFETKEDEEASICLMADSENEEVFFFDKSPLYIEFENQSPLLLKKVSEIQDKKEKLQISNNELRNTIQKLIDSGRSN